MLQNPHRHRYGGRRRDRRARARHRRDRKAELRGTRATVRVGGGAWLDNEPKRRSKVAARTARGRVAHGAARPHGRARRPENPRVHKQQPAPHGNT